MSAATYVDMVGTAASDAIGGVAGVAPISGLTGIGSGRMGSPPRYRVDGLRADEERGGGGGDPVKESQPPSNVNAAPQPPPPSQSSPAASAYEPPTSNGRGGGGGGGTGGSSGREKDVVDIQPRYTTSRVTSNGAADADADAANYGGGSSPTKKNLAYYQPKSQTPYYEMNHRASYYSPHKEATVSALTSRAPSAHYSRHMVKVRDNENYVRGRSTSRNGNYNNDHDHHLSYSNSHNNNYSSSNNNHNVERGGGGGGGGGGNYLASSPPTGMRLSRSLNLLPLSREAASVSFREEVNKGAWDFPTTLKRDYRYHDSFQRSRSQAFRHRPQLTIAIEGKRDFSPEKREAFLPYTPRAIASARPQARVHPSTVQIGLSRAAPVEISDDFGVMRTSHYYGGGGGGGANGAAGEYYAGVSSAKKMPDPRWEEGTTTKSTYRRINATEDQLRSRPTSSMRPWTSTVRTGLSVGEDGVQRPFDPRTTIREHYKKQPMEGTRPMPDIKPSMMPRGEGRMSSDTTYHVDIEEKATFHGLTPKRRFDPAFKRQDSIDWM